MNFKTGFFEKRRPGATLAGVFSVALGSVLLLCGAGLTPTGNVQKSDVNANGFSLTNAATVSATNFMGNANALTNFPSALVLSPTIAASTYVPQTGLTTNLCINGFSFPTTDGITGSINTTSDGMGGVGGSINLTSADDGSGGTLNLSGNDGNGGNINLSANGTEGSAPAGNINLSTDGSNSAGSIDLSAQLSGGGGSINLSAAGEGTAGSINLSVSNVGEGGGGGSINLSSDGYGDGGGSIISQGLNGGNGGSINLSGFGDSGGGNINLSVASPGMGGGGTINLSSDGMGGGGGEINCAGSGGYGGGTLNMSGSSSGPGGSITMTGGAGSITMGAGSIYTQGANLYGVNETVGGFVPLFDWHEALGQTAAYPSVLQVTPVNDGNLWRVQAALTVKTVTTDVIQMQVVYTDENSVTQTVNLGPSVSTTGVVAIPPLLIMPLGGTSITINAVLTTSSGTISYDVGATLECLGSH